MKKLVAILTLLALCTVIVAACGGSSAANGPNPVHMSETVFVQDSITIKKGESITLINDSAVPHYIDNGLWENNAVKRTSTPGSPVTSAVTYGAYDGKPLGPFNTAGAFQLYCTVHPGMNLTVHVV
jgi:plastocyanin